MIRLNTSGCSTFGKWRALAISSYRPPGTSPARRRFSLAGVPGSSAPHTTRVGTRSAGSCPVKSNLMIAAEQPRYPAGVVAATVSRICFHRPGFLALNASVNQRSTVPSASGSSEFARRTVFIRSSHSAAAPAGLDGSESLHRAEISLAPWSTANAWPIIPPIEGPIVHSGEGKHLEHRGNVPRERLHRVVAGDRIAAAMAAHVDAQYAKPGLQQRGHLLGPHPAIGCQ